MIKVAQIPRTTWNTRLREMAKLRTSIFRSFPYLYDGTYEYEAEYLTHYFKCQRACVVGAFDGEALVGMATAVHLPEADKLFQAPFRAQNHNVDDIVYFGESLLLPEYRGQGIGHLFFSERESFAAHAVPNLQLTTFCAVERSPTDSRRPTQYKPLDEFWHKRGYLKQPTLQTSFEWKEVDSVAPTQQTMTFWSKPWQ